MEDDLEPDYCDCCFKEISSYQCTAGEGFCNECADINEQENAL